MTRDDGEMLVTVPNPGLSELLASSVLLSQAWPEADQEVMTLVHVLRIAVPSLDEALSVGLIKLLTPAKGKASANIGLTHKRAVLTGIALRHDDRSRVTAPHTRLGEVTWLEVRDIEVEGRSGLRMTG